MDGALLVIGTTPIIHKAVGWAVAFSPVAPFIAETGIVYDEEDRGYSSTHHSSTFLYISDFETSEVIGKIPIYNAPRTLSFSPNGKSLLAMTGSRGIGKGILIYREPWGSEPVIFDKTLNSVFHGAWIDNHTVLAAGTVAHNALCIALVDSERKELQILYDERLDGQQITSTAWQK